MKTIRRGRLLCLTGVGLALSLLVGCQTQMGGMTLPSGRYLEHLPQYFPQEPDFPLQRELQYQEETAGLSAPGNRPAAANGVNPVPPGFAPAPPDKAEMDFRRDDRESGTGTSNDLRSFAYIAVLLTLREDSPHAEHEEYNTPHTFRKTSS